MASSALLKKKRKKVIAVSRANKESCATLAASQRKCVIKFSQLLSFCLRRDISIQVV